MLQIEVQHACGTCGPDLGAMLFMGCRKRRLWIWHKAFLGLWSGTAQSSCHTASHMYRQRS